MANLRRYLDFRGRAPRLEYWQVQLASSVVAGVCVLLAMLVVPVAGPAGGAVMLLVIPLLLASLATGVRRLHDRNKSGWWLLIYWLAPTAVSAWAETQSEGSDMYMAAVALSLAGLAVTIWSLVELGFLKGSQGPNRFGAVSMMPVSAEVFS